MAQKDPRTHHQSAPRATTGRLNGGCRRQSPRPLSHFPSPPAPSPLSPTSPRPSLAHIQESLSKDGPGTEQTLVPVCPLCPLCSLIPLTRVTQGPEYAVVRLLSPPTCQEELQLQAFLPFLLPSSPSRITQTFDWSLYDSFICAPSAAQSVCVAL